MSKLKTLQDAARAEAKAAREIAEKAHTESRDLTSDERASFKGHQEKARALFPQIEQAKADEEIIAASKALADGIGGPFGVSRRDLGRKGWANETVKSLRGSMTDQRGAGIKALVSGTIGVANPVGDGITTDGAAPRTILDLLRGESPEDLARVGIGVGDPDKPGSVLYQSAEQLASSLFGGDGGGSNTFSYLRQIVRTNNAAPVADNALKPTSIYTVSEIEDRYRVIAHLSEAIPQRYFHDDRSLGEFLASEMALGLEWEVEAQALSGDGTGENLTGILSTSGIQIQAYAADLLTTTRQALTKLQVRGMTPTAWAVNPADAEKFDLLREGTGDGAFLLGGPGSGAASSLWTIPRVPSNAVPVGTAVLADWTQARLQVRQDATLHVDTSGELFKQNQAIFRVEGRFGLAVKRPSAFVSVDLTAA
ncbi:phage major capsid protein [uncultured Arthrobacter sp.]|uniref:phage major capsid protein n=1 Tax=uncultured Arthrobacter sp. TaxID=114050 RepID=UPI002632777A|nr:phage major capsid protein [uncultured Arthrobacter sp.]